MFQQWLEERFFCKHQNAFILFLYIPCTTEVERSALLAGRAEAALWLPGCHSSSGGSGCLSPAWLSHDISKFVPAQLKQAAVHGIGISIKAELGSVIPGHCSEKTLYFLEAEL